MPVPLGLVQPPRRVRVRLQRPDHHAALCRARQHPAARLTELRAVSGGREGQHAGGGLRVLEHHVRKDRRFAAEHRAGVRTPRRGARPGALGARREGKSPHALVRGRRPDLGHVLLVHAGVLTRRVRIDAAPPGDQRCHARLVPVELAHAREPDRVGRALRVDLEHPAHRVGGEQRERRLGRMLRIAAHRLRVRRRRQRGNARHRPSVLTECAEQARGGGQCALRRPRRTRLLGDPVEQCANVPRTYRAVAPTAQQAPVRRHGTQRLDKVRGGIGHHADLRQGLRRPHPDALVPRAREHERSPTARLHERGGRRDGPGVAAKQALRPPGFQVHLAHHAPALGRVQQCAVYAAPARREHLGSAAVGAAGRRSDPRHVQRHRVAIRARIRAGRQRRGAAAAEPDRRAKRRTMCGPLRLGGTLLAHRQRAIRLEQLRRRCSVHLGRRVELVADVSPGGGSSCTLVQGLAAGSATAV